MSTRGAVGFRINGQDKMTIVDEDAYPAGLGNDVLSWVANHRHVSDITWRIMSIPEAIHFVTNDHPDPFERVLRRGYFVSENELLLDSLLCEWAYVINFDTEQIEVYAGFQREVHCRGRYATVAHNVAQYLAKGTEAYYPCALLGTIPFTDLPTEHDELGTRFAMESVPFLVDYEDGHSRDD